MSPEPLLAPRATKWTCEFWINIEHKEENITIEAAKRSQTSFPMTWLLGQSFGILISACGKLTTQPQSDKIDTESSSAEANGSVLLSFSKQGSVSLSRKTFKRVTM